MTVKPTLGNVDGAVEFAILWPTRPGQSHRSRPFPNRMATFLPWVNRLRSAAGYVLELDAPEKSCRCQRRGMNTGKLAGMWAQPICGPKKRLPAGYKRRRLAPKKQKRTRSLLRKVKALLSPKKQKV